MSQQLLADQAEIQVILALWLGTLPNLAAADLGF
jgi:hypothetical protein